jgi:phosphoenolpyruvate carboxylase
MPEPDQASRHLPPGLTETVGGVQEILGRVAAAAGGAALFDAIEAVRQEMVAFREADSEVGREAALDRASGILAGLSLPNKTDLARAYTLYLQLINVCENAYRTHRLRPRLGKQKSAEVRAQVTFVLTAHPTESRSPDNIRALRRVQDEVVSALAQERPIDRDEVENLLHLAWKIGTHPPSKPSVEDEANHLVSLLTDPILSEVIALNEAGNRVLFRSWVGGDKDGHPDVGPDQTQAALNLSRGRLLAFARARMLETVRGDVALVALAGGEAVESALGSLEEALARLETVAEGDGGRVGVLHAAIDDFQAAYRERFGIAHPAVRRLATLLEVFPALVVPLELREERGHFATDDPIAHMMRRVREIARGGCVDAYTRAMVVSMTLEAGDLLEAQQLVREVFDGPALPVIPLFELPEVLDRAPAILRDAWEDGSFRRAARERGHLEVMLGYSDTAKRMGMLASRVALHGTMRRIVDWAEAEEITPLFFHGHGGSVGRGGGRFEDLVATWPQRARTPYKYTLQGEMVERTLATPEILRSLVGKVADVQSNPPPYRGVSHLARDLARTAQASFAARVESDAFRALLGAATPYTRLQELTIGSRPARRGGGGLEKLRAIPWVLCWTQTRLLVHAWLGTGDAWREWQDGAGSETIPRDALAEACREDPLFRSYTRLLSFTMAKTEPALWRRYRRALADNVPAGLIEELTADYEAALDLALQARGSDTLLPDRPWLQESIRYRAPMIHPLNLLQIELLAKAEWNEAEVQLFRETVTGIAAGMLTTG